MDRFEAGLRPLADARPLATEGEPRLVGRIRDEILRAGPMTFERFMAMALYEPDLGYYRTATDRATRSGDFLTAPEIHPIFGALIARQLDEVHRRLGAPGRFVVREYGAGSGALALTVLEALDGRGALGRVSESPVLASAIRYVPIEVDAVRRKAIVERLTAAGFGSSLEPDLPADAPETGAVLANEFLDALPVHRVIGRSRGPRELAVDWADDRFVEVEIEPSTAALATRLTEEGIVLADGARGEICLELAGRLGEMSAGLARGIALIVDYGHEAADLYAPGRSGGTLRAYAGHRVHDDWAVAVGRQDLTAHVDFTAVARSATGSGLTSLGLTSQAEFLMGVGADEALEAIRSDPATTAEDWLAVRSAIRRLLDPRALGGFKVALLGRGIDAEPALAGLSYRLRR